ncbi:DUF4241 domain-containing protein [Gynurincola endophyticus]|uniref:DUF4241 domain-containing protein n=1 Tax=Gynurincola endophyticus TaxID=2479004 RepID=UPI000F8E194F|nr:DUF4241 domain-containing protein [Gynurincola endophyticus]
MDFLRSKTDYSTYFTGNQENMSLMELNLGNLYLPSGQIVACDPLVCLGRSLAFNKTLPAGSYPVTAYVKQNEEQGDRIALIKIEFKPDTTVRWEMALTEFDDIALMTKPDDFFGFPVDSGLASLCDAETQELYEAFTDKYYSEQSGTDIYTDYFKAMFEKNAAETDTGGNWINFTIPHSTLHNVVMFSSGFGDGNYPCYWGINAKNEVCSLVVDFFVLSH